MRTTRQSKRSLDEASPNAQPQSLSLEGQQMAVRSKRQRAEYEQLDDPATIQGDELAMAGPGTSMFPGDSEHQSLQTANQSLQFGFEPPMEAYPSNIPSALVAGSGRKVAGCPLEDAGLSLPAFLPAIEHERRLLAIDQELSYQESNPPVLPASTLPGLPPKQFMGALYEIPDDNPKLAEILMKRNTEILAKSKKEDKSRNNMAAKSTRDRRIEALKLTREVLNEHETELHWWRLRAITLGAQPGEWRAVSDQVKTSMRKTLEERLKEANLKTEKKMNEKNKERMSTHTSKHSKLTKADSIAKAKEAAQLKAQLEREESEATARLGGQEEEKPLYFDQQLLQHQLPNYLQEQEDHPSTMF
ncbi:hypothetical protein FALBO_1393 [Fusarium albosuccineum]|uniref:Uncharacterized protein n=1 Tax=Fusarium albosuccineum TaxID=1237068 RepID=A0A8H4PDM0_9HYPO|nr:hypothetical protein FALBO_1393 [Fusarium albosuccineum]